MKTVKLFVEGGGDSNALRTECRAAFSSFLQKAGLSEYMPRIVASGSRRAAYEDFCTSINAGETAVLLVDSEAGVLIRSDDLNYNETDFKSWNPWHHLKNRLDQDGNPVDNWDKPARSSDEDCHLMVESMETWFLADISALREYYGRDLNENSLPKRSDIENIKKTAVMASLSKATRNTRKGQYSKGKHSFDILKIVDPNQVTDKSPWARRFVVLLHEKMRTIR